MNFRKVAKVSLQVLFGHPLRTFLSCLAVSIGVSAVVMMVGSGKAAQEEAMKKIKNMGTDLITGDCLLKWESYKKLMKEKFQGYVF